ncbi:MAG TPA: hypothetical protein VKA86_00390 [Candidatus Krumholzibacteria bacterium]|nr:hypothetical protein [Candidatus Krumholzibacteria bacterium]
MSTVPSVRTLFLVDGCGALMTAYFVGEILVVMVLVLFEARAALRTRSIVERTS